MNLHEPMFEQDRVDQWFPRELFACNCGTLSHQVVVSFFMDEPHELTFEVSMMENRPWWERLWVGVRYILGFRAKNDYFYGTTGLGYEQVERLMAFCDQFLQRKREYHAGINAELAGAVKQPKPLVSEGNTTVSSDGTPNSCGD